MGYVAQYPALVAELLRLRGSLGTDSKGNAVPSLTGDDTVGVLALYASGLVNAIASRAKVVLAEYVDASGIVPPLRVPFVMHSPQSPRAFLAAPATSIAWKRTIAGAAWTPAREGSDLRDPQAEQVYFLRESITTYEAALRATVQGFELYGSWVDRTKVSVKLSRDQVSAFLASVRSLGTSLDVMGENAPTTLMQDLRGALKASAGATGEALKEGADLAGRVAAGVSNTLGEMTGNFLEGFLKNAGLLTLVIAGIVVYKVMP